MDWNVLFPRLGGALCWRAAFPARRTLGPRFGYPGGVRYNSGMFRANITQSTLTPEMSAYLDALATRAKAGKSAAEAPPAHTARVAPAAPEPAPKGRSRKARGDVSTSEGRRPALNLIGSYDPVDQSAILRVHVQVTHTIQRILGTGLIGIGGVGGGFAPLVDQCC